MKRPFPELQQLDDEWMRPTCFALIAKYYGRIFSVQTLRESRLFTRTGVSMLGYHDAAESIGFHTNGLKVSFDALVKEAPFPCILHWNQNHFVVCYGIKKKQKTRLHYKNIRP